MRWVCLRCRKVDGQLMLGQSVSPTSFNVQQHAMPNDVHKCWGQELHAQARVRNDNDINGTCDIPFSRYSFAFCVLPPAHFQCARGPTTRMVVAPLIAVCHLAPSAMPEAPISAQPPGSARAGVQTSVHDMLGHKSEVIGGSEQGEDGEVVMYKSSYSGAWPRSSAPGCRRRRPRSSLSSDR